MSGYENEWICTHSTLRSSLHTPLNRASPSISSLNMRKSAGATCGGMLIKRSLTSQPTRAAIAGALSMCTTVLATAGRVSRAFVAMNERIFARDLML